MATLGTILSNLEYGTQLDNMADALRHGTVARGKSLPQTKLNEHQVSEIRRRYATGESIRTLAQAYAVSWATCQDVINGTSWAHVGSEVQQ